MRPKVRVVLRQLRGPCVLVLVLGHLACAPTEAQQRQPNIILVSLDTLRADHLGCYGYERDTTPNLDALAMDSLVFERAIAQSSHTEASHNALFQSRYPTLTSNSMPCLAEGLKNGGYQTVGITGGGRISAELGFDRGFDRYEEFPSGFGDSFPVAEHFLRQEVKGPFFLFLHSYDIHGPYDPGPPYEGLFTEKYDGPITPGATEQLMRSMLGLPSPGGELLKRVKWDAADRAYFRALYDGGIRKSDEVMGKLIALLDTLESWDWERDILVVLSDHGEEFWEHGSVGHGFTLYQELVRVPLIIRAPGGGVVPRRITQTVMLIDVAPTLLEMAEIDVPEAFHGQSLTPLINGDERLPGQRTAASLTVNRLGTIIHYPWKLIHSRKTERTELYNLEADPSEQQSLTEDKPELAEKMMQTYEEQITEGREIPLIIDADQITDEKLLEQLRTLGYVE